MYFIYNHFESGIYVPYIQPPDFFENAMYKQSFLVLFFCVASLIRGNRANCALFCDNLDWLVSKLDRLEASSGINRQFVHSKTD